MTTKFYPALSLNYIYSCNIPSWHFYCFIERNCGLVCVSGQLRTSFKVPTFHMAEVLLFCYYWWIFNNKYLSFYHSSSGTLQRIIQLHHASIPHSSSVNCPILQFFLSLGDLNQSLWYCRNQVFQLQPAAIFLGCTLGLWYTGRVKQRIWRGSGGEIKRFRDRHKLSGCWPFLYRRVFWKMWTSHSYSAMCLIEI